MKTHNNESTYAETATYLRTALLLGLIIPEQAIAWADSVIHNDPTPPALIYTLALTAPELSAVREALRPLALVAEPSSVIAAALGLAARDLASGRRNVDDTLRVLSQLRRFVKLDPHLDAEIKNLVAEHMLAIAGIRPERLEAIRARVASLMAGYATVQPLVTPKREHA